jgi:hypothetical protein
MRITISLWSLLAVLLLSSLSHALECRFAWLPPTLSVDGTPLDDLAGYRLYTAPIAGGYTLGAPAFDVRLAQLEQPATPSLLVPCLVRSFWAVTAYDTMMNESAFSNEVLVQDTLAPQPPGTLRVLELILRLGP